MAEQLFVDKGAFYALMIEADVAHRQVVSALDELRAGKTNWTTSDYVLDESATLLNARGCHAQTVELLALVGKSRALQVEWMNPQRFAKTRGLFAKYSDQGFSFTDCFSFALMRELKTKKALTKDRHFSVMGLEPLLK